MGRPLQDVSEGNSIAQVERFRNRVFVIKEVSEVSFVTFATVGQPVELAKLPPCDRMSMILRNERSTHKVNDS